STGVPARALPRNPMAREPIRRSLWRMAAKSVASRSRHHRALVPVGARSGRGVRRSAAREAAESALHEHLRVPFTTRREERNPAEAISADRVRLAAPWKEGGNAQLRHQPCAGQLLVRAA